MAGGATFGFVLVVGAGFLGYEAIQLLTKSSTPTATGGAVRDATGPTTGAAVGAGGAPPSSSQYEQGQTAFGNLPADVQGAINQALLRAQNAGTLNVAEAPSWRGALALILNNENNTYNPCAYYGNAGAQCGSPQVSSAIQSGLATGLFQVKPGTFAQYVPGGDITNPADSAYAAVQELLHAWGGNPWAPLQNNPYQGY